MNKFGVAKAQQKAKFSAGNPALVFLETLFLIWVVVPPLRCLLLVLKLLGLVRVQGYNPLKFQPQKGQGLLVIHRHPSMRETVIVPLLVSGHLEYMFDFSKMPLGTPDKHNYYDPWWCWPIRPISIPVERGNSKKEAEAALRMRWVLEQGRTLVTAPEGGRTFKGAEFKAISAQGDIVVFSRPEQAVDLHGPVVRRFQVGIRKIVGENVRIVPIWVESRGWRTNITIGDPFSFAASFPQRDIPDALEDIMLRLAEK